MKLDYIFHRRLNNHQNSTGLTELKGKLVVTEYDGFALIKHPAGPRGKQQPNWCLADR